MWPIRRAVKLIRTANIMILICRLLGIFGGLFTIAIGSWAMGSKIAANGLIFLAWSISPYAMLFFLCTIVKTKKATITLLLVSIFTVAVGVYSLLLAFVFALDPQSGLLFIFLPMWQWVAIILALLLILLFDRRKSK